ncbi:type I restriction enzyme, S subunit [Eubacterium ruminantium]|nr:type I restriction enzyme, S subunit [Eubacterium ruminantium]
MSKFKECDIKEFGLIPERWIVPKIGYYFDMSSGDSLTSKDIDEYEGTYTVYGANGERGYYSRYNTHGKHILLGRVGALCGNVHVIHGKNWVTEHALILTKRKEEIVEEYFGYLFETMNLGQYSKSSAQPVISVDTISQLKFIVPSVDEQKRIAGYLDFKCSEIDSLRADIEAEIETLEEYKKSVITEAVTKGLDRNAPMKDSGIEWIGNIPKQWSLIPFRYVLNERTEKNNPIRTDERLSLSIDIGVTLYADKTTNLDRYKDDVSQYKIAHEGDLVMNSMNVIVGAVGVSKWFGCVSPAYYTYFDNEPDSVTSRFCDYIFRTPSMRKILFSLGKGIMAIDRGEGRVNTCRLKVSREDLRKIVLPIPDVAEQRKIVRYLDDKCLEIDSIVEDKKKQLNVLADYKKSLIYEYVTGKKEVPNE